jgi:hypothetical protein
MKGRSPNNKKECKKRKNYINLARLTLWIEFSNEFPYVIPLSLPVIAGPIRKARKIV